MGEKYQLYLEIESRNSDDWNNIRSIVETLNGIDIKPRDETNQQFLEDLEEGLVLHEKIIRKNYVQFVFFKKVEERLKMGTWRGFQESSLILTISSVYFITEAGWTQTTLDSKTTNTANAAKCSPRLLSFTNSNKQAVALWLKLVKMPFQGRTNTKN